MSHITNSLGQHGAHLGPVGPRWAPCWPHKPCYQECLVSKLYCIYPPTFISWGPWNGSVSIRQTPLGQLYCSDNFICYATQLGDLSREIMIVCWYIMPEHWYQQKWDLVMTSFVLQAYVLNALNEKNLSVCLLYPLLAWFLSSNGMVL